MQQTFILWSTHDACECLLEAMFICSSSCGSLRERRSRQRFHTQHLTGPGTLAETSCGNTLLLANMVALSFQQPVSLPGDKPPICNIECHKNDEKTIFWLESGRTIACARVNVKRQPFYACAPLSILRRWHHNLSQTIVFIIFARCFYLAGCLCVYSRRLSARAKLKMARKKEMSHFLMAFVGR